MESKRIQFNPLDITESLGYQTFRRDSRKPWSREEDQKLHALIHDNLLKLGFNKGIEELNHNEELVNEVNWDEVGDVMSTRKARDCRKRWVNSLNPNLKKGKWTSQEDQQLLESFKKHGSSWQKIAIEIPGRTEDQCAKRYIEVLDPNTKDRLRPWTLEEDLNLIKKVKNYGTKWRTISLEMESRPSLTCRNRWRKIVTDVVRGKANEIIKEEIDSIQGGLSKVEEISENFQNKKIKKEEDSIPNSESDQHKKPLNHNNINNNHYNQNSHHQNTQKPMLQNQQARYTPYVQSLTSVNSPNYADLTDDSPKPTSIEMDWKYTLKDTSGLTLSNGNISSDELAKQLIENAKKYDLKISIHQHIHHHYGSNNTNNNNNHSFNNNNNNNKNNINHTNSNNSKVPSPAESSSNLSGNTQTEDLTYRYSHFNYLPPMAQPHLQSSNLISRDNDLNKLLNPSTQHLHSLHQQHHGTKSRLSNNSGNLHHPLDTQDHTYEVFEEELDFWETMRSLSQFNTNNPIPGASKPVGEKKMKNNEINVNEYEEEDDDNDSDEIGLYYGMEETVQRDLDLGFPGPVLPFNPS